MAVNEGGKYTKLTPETVKKLEEVFAIDGTVEEGCFYAEISRQTYYNWIKENPKMNERFDSLRERPVLKARQEVIKGLNCYANAMDYLKRKKKLEFSERHELTGADGIALIPSDEERLRADKALTEYLYGATGNTNEGNDNREESTF